MSLTAERLREVLAYDPETGVFTWLVKPNRRIVVGSVAGTPCNGRIQIKVDGELRRAHRLAWLYVHGRWPEHVIDHINGDPSDNRIANLRDVPQAVNSQNRRAPQSNNKAGFLGVHWYAPNSRWCAHLRTNGKSKNLGYFTTADEAHVAYITAKRATHIGNTL